MVTTAMTSYGIDFLNFLKRTITTFGKAMPSESTGAEYLLQIVKLHHLQEILCADLVLGVWHPHIQWNWSEHNPVIALQVMDKYISDKLGAQVSLAWRMMLLVHELQILQRCWEMRVRWESAGAHWICPHATRHLLMEASSQPPPADKQYPR